MSPNCPRHEALSAYVDGELSAFERTQFERHLQTCTACSHLASEIHALQATFRSLPDPAPGFDLAPSLADRLRARRKQIRASWWRQPHAPALAAPALATFSSLMGGFALGLSLAVAPAPRPAALPAAMAVFDAVPPGGICLVAASCPTRGAGR